ncbi:MAG TPA: hypothetical protein VEK15_26470 [Vicinamibacteria bacterium]|nr:hypothetical protein [Vicinamibacteria bacterium]
MKPGHLCLGLLAGTLAATPLLAQELGVRSYGLRGGINVNPDQFNFGAHIDAGRLGPRIRLQPSFELGLGNGVTLAAANIDVHYLFAARAVRPYAGGGLGVNFIDVTSGVGRANGLDVAPVLNLVGGVEWGVPRRYLLEARLGLGDTPELKLVAGFTF